MLLQKPIWATETVIQVDPEMAGNGLMKYPDLGPLDVSELL